jgi:hypothetical protein
MQSRGSSLTFGWISHRRNRHSLIRPAFAITRADAAFSASQTAPMRKTDDWATPKP